MFGVCDSNGDGREGSFWKGLAKAWSLASYFLDLATASAKGSSKVVTGPISDSSEPNSSSSRLGSPTPRPSSLGSLSDFDG